MGASVVTAHRPQPRWHDARVAVTRLIAVDDAPVLAELQQANREFLAPWSPRREPAHYTLQGQRRAVADALVAHAKGTVLPHVILADGEVVANQGSDKRRCGPPTQAGTRSSRRFLARYSASNTFRTPLT